MINILPHNQCKMVNIVWIERGILLTIIYFIVKEYENLINKRIIINNIKYINLLKLFFPKLKFRLFKKHKKRNFYFNIRTIIKQQDIIIDYISNYNEIINTNKISLVPWFDMNDVLISYKYDKNQKLHVNKYLNVIKNFSYYKRCNYNNTLWDVYVENYIFAKYNKFNYVNIQIFMNYFNNFIKTNYTNTVIEVPKVYYIEKPNDNNVNVNNIENEEKLNELINLINDKFNLINKIL